MLHKVGVVILIGMCFNVYGRNKMENARKPEVPRDFQADFGRSWPGADGKVGDVCVYPTPTAVSPGRSGRVRSLLPLYLEDPASRGQF